MFRSYIFHKLLTHPFYLISFSSLSSYERTEIYFTGFVMSFDFKGLFWHRELVIVNQVNVWLTQIVSLITQLGWLTYLQLAIVI
jgi:hypothetical protein